MSLSALAIRACTYLALKGATWAGECVYESKLEPIDAIVQDTAQPFITVAIDEASGEPKEHGASLLSAVDRLLLVVEIAVGVRALAADGSVVVGIPPTDRGLEWSLELIARQVMGALSTGDTWADLWRRFHLALNSVRLLRGGAVEGERYAARQIVFDLHPIADPDLGQVPEQGSVWADFAAALKALDAADPELAEYRDLADLIESELGRPVGLLPWEAAVGRLGLARETGHALGIAPVGDEPALLSGATMLGATIDPARAGAVGTAEDVL